MARVSTAVRDVAAAPAARIRPRAPSEPISNSSRASQRGMGQRVARVAPSALHVDIVTGLVTRAERGAAAQARSLGVAQHGGARAVEPAGALEERERAHNIVHI